MEFPLNLQERGCTYIAIFLFVENIGHQTLEILKKNS